jgi:putative endonuclease
MYYIYIIESLKNGRYYVGSTVNLRDRMKRHNSGQMKSTKPHMPHKIVYTEPFPTLSEARKREAEIKKKIAGILKT